ncbi:hypothetical protein B0T26DRAFT_680903 [Lasiosphaeria miniovina]|uniref:Uncharacterized protein n=1 Tax=Lasiosphaeria miniovina TaxID=1954250 RepID=A0AA40DHD4_9PEZI|nr:uncharacterized protein B0T26DRAFT_680903 [Lasiosphaeria miniovina]KAK0703175.1 hypothetical protein B0T26DRAFT_680903 [Lasiosphaeria miniovina]
MSQSSQSTTEAPTTEAPASNLESHYALSHSWASYIGAQFTGQEVLSLRGAVDRHFRQTNTSMTSLQNDLARTQQLIAAALAESKATSERILSEVASLKQDLVKIHESIEARGQNQPIISNTSLDNEAEAGATQPDTQERQTVVSNTSLDDEAEVADMATQPDNWQESQIVVRNVDKDSQVVNGQVVNSQVVKQKGGTRLAGRSFERTLHSNREFRRVYHSSIKEYENSKPISDVAFMWKFIHSIDNFGLSLHIQEWLVAGFPKYVYARKQIRGQSDEHHITISRKLS